LEVTISYATEHGNHELQRYISWYNLCAREKTLVPAEQVLILIPDSTSKTFSRWIGPAKVIERKSSDSYILEHDGVSRHLHADKLCKYHLSV